MVILSIRRLGAPLTQALDYCPKLSGGGYLFKDTARCLSSLSQYGLWYDL
jgi:hypothetical protein